MENKQNKIKKNINSKQNELTRAQKEDLKTAFNLFDTDGSGTIEITDLKVALRALGFEPKKEEIKYLVSELQSNNNEGGNNKKIDFNEFIQIMELKMSEKESKEETKKVFELFMDQNKNEITFESLKKIAAEIEENITDEELMAMLKEANKSKTSENVKLSQFEEVIQRSLNY